MAKKKDQEPKLAEAPKAPKQMAPTEGKLVPKEIHIKLTPAQCLERGARAADLDKELMKLEEEYKVEEDAWKQRRAQHKTSVKNLTEQRRKISVEIHAKAAVETKDVLLHLNYPACQAEYWYPPQGESEIVDTRPLEENELQMTMMQEKVDAMPETGQAIEEEDEE